MHIYIYIYIPTNTYYIHANTGGRAHAIIPKKQHAHMRRCTQTQNNNKINRYIHASHELSSEALIVSVFSHTHTYTHISIKHTHTHTHINHMHTYLA